MRRVRKSRAISIAMAVLLGVGGAALAVGPAAAATTLSGSATCGATSSGAFVGMWVSTNAGGNGWASWSRIGGDPYNVRYSKTIPSGATSVSVSVGCGGTPSNWAASYAGSVRVSSGSGTAGKDWICSNYYGSNRCI
jgi:hypothetical protein